MKSLNPIGTPERTSRTWNKLALVTSRSSQVRFSKPTRVHHTNAFNPDGKPLLGLVDLTCRLHDVRKFSKSTRVHHSNPFDPELWLSLEDFENFYLQALTDHQRQRK